jgi:hypothetical protein
MSCRIPSAACRLRIAACALFDHPFDHRDGEGDARRLDRLKIDGREQPWLRSIAPIWRRIGENVRKRADALAGFGL